MPILRKAAVFGASLALAAGLLTACGTRTPTGASGSGQSHEMAAAQAAVAAARKTPDGTARQAAYAKALDLFDQAAQQDPTVETSPAFIKMLDDYSASLIETASHPEMDVEQRRRLLATARFVAERKPDAAGQGMTLLSIARQQIKVGDYTASADTLTAAFFRLADVQPAQRDPIVASLTRTLAFSASGRPRAAMWASTISDPRLRTAVLVDVARLRLQTGDFAAPELAPLKGLHGSELDKRGRDLVEIAETLRVRGELAMASTTATAARIGTPQRDELLQTLAQEATTGEQRDAVESAAFGISNRTMQGNALLSLALANAQTSRLSIAQRLSLSLTSSSQRAQVLSRVAVGYAQSHLTQPARATLKVVQSITPFMMPRLAKSQVNQNLADAYIRLGEFNDGLKFANRISEHAPKAAILEQLTEASNNALDWAASDKGIDALQQLGERDAAALLKADMLSEQGKPGDLQSLANAQHTPGVRAWVLAYAVEAQIGALDKVKVDQTLQTLDGMRRTAKSVADIQSIASASVFAYAAAGQPDKAETFLPDANSDDNDLYGRALSQLAASWAKAGNRAGVDRTLSWAEDDKQLARVLSRIVLALASVDNFELAAEYARQIPDYQPRVYALHQLAMTSARSLDTYKYLRGEVPPARRDDGERDLVMKTTGYSYYSLGNDNAGGVIPGLPRSVRYNRLDVSEGIPEGSEGRVYLIPMEYSFHNTKFMSQVNSVFRSIGDKVFPVQAQGTRYPRYIHIESGVMTLESLARQLNELGEGDALVRRGGRYTLNLPLLIAPGASLVVSGTDASELRLNSASGVFIVNAGKLWFHDVTVAGWDPALKSYAPLTLDTRTQFRPFIIAWGGSEMNADASHFHHLGFSGDKGYGFSYCDGPSSLERERPGALKRPTGTIVENSFEDQYFGFFTTEADDVNVIGNEYKNNLIYGADPHDYSRRLVMAYNTSYGAFKKHGFITSREVDDSWIFGNLVFDNHGTGIMLDRLSSGNVIYANRVWGNGQEGMAVFESPCNILAGNFAGGNKGDAVKVRNSTDIGIFRNQLETSGRTGVNIYVGDPKAVVGFAARDLKRDPYAKYVTVAVLDNTIDKHGGAGITATGFGAVALKGNQYIGSSDKILQGDLAPLDRELSRLQSEGVVVRSTCPTIVVEKVCRFTSNGMMTGLVENLPPAAGKQAMCQGSAAPDQETEEANADANADAP